MFGRLAAFACSLLWVAWLATAHAIPTEQAGPPDLEKLLPEWQQALDAAERMLSASEISDVSLEEWRTRLSEIRLAARLAADQAKPSVVAASEELKALGSPPGPEAPAESEDVARRRTSINERLARAEGRIKQADLVIARAETLRTKLAQEQRERYTAKILTRGLSPLAPAVWRVALPELSERFASVRLGWSRWSDEALRSARTDPSFEWRCGIALGLAAVCIGPLRSRLRRRIVRLQAAHALIYSDRLRATVLTAALEFALPAFGLAIVFAAATGNVPWVSQLPPLSRMIGLAALFWLAVTASCRAVLMPDSPAFGLVEIAPDVARAVYSTVRLIALLFGIDWVLDELSDEYEPSLELVVLHNFVSGSMIAVLLMSLLRSRLWRSDRKAPMHPFRWCMRAALGIFGAAIPLTAIVGYVALSRLMASQIVLTAGLYFLISTVRAIGVESVAFLFGKDSPISEWLRKGLALSDDACELWAFWLGGLLGLVAWAAGLMALLVVWGAGGNELADWLYRTWFGFKVGTVTIALADIVLAVVLFVGLLLVTRLSQRTLERRVFPRARLSIGLRHSIGAAIGYAGFILAAGLAVSTLGIDLSNLAIIAGALSVGIGFGLQNIINNFVSGIILLIERPIKVGDWVIVGDVEGYVRKISVRATEIQTFDRSEVFVPNSELISRTLKNRTHASKEGRVTLHLSVAYGSDIQRLRDKLLELAAEHSEVLPFPKPQVFFKAFGESGLDFDIFVYLVDIDRALSVTSDLYFAIDAMLREERIEVPYPQYDVHLKNFDRLEALIRDVVKVAAQSQSQLG